MKKIIFTRKQNAISEIIATVLLLLISVSVFAAVYLSIFGISISEPAVALDVLSFIDEEDNIIFEHHGGQELPSNSKVLFTIAGQRIVKTISESISDEWKNGTSSWSYGETLQYSFGNLSDLNVEVAIDDVNANALVLLGNIQKGYIMPAFGLGGIWHFNENVGLKTYDATFNNNTGYIQGAQWCQGINSSALSYNPLGLGSYYDGIDYVYVNQSPSLNIQNNLTMEAWIKPYEMSFYVENKTLSQKFGYTPDIINMRNDTFAVASEIQGKGGLLAIVNMYQNGSIQIPDDDWEFGNTSSTPGQSLKPELCNVTEEIVAISYVENNDERVYVKTARITDTDTIEPISQHRINRPNAFDPDICFVNRSCYAVVFGQSTDGYVYTLNISDDGYIEETGFSLKLPDISWMEPSIVRLTETLFAIGYASSSGIGITTVEIDQNGAITLLYTVHIPEIEARDSVLTALSSHRVTLTYSADKNGFIRVFDIESNGQIINLNKILALTTSDPFFNPCVINPYPNVVLIVYSDKLTGGPNGFFTTININESADLTRLKGPTAFETSKCFNPEVVQLNQWLYGVVYRGFGDHDGLLKTILIDTGAVPDFQKVITKNNSYGLSLNTTTAFATINNQRYEAPITGIPSENGWYHLAVTYNQKNLSIVCNAQNVTTIIVSDDTNIPITRSSSPLLFGYGFYGIIDEVGIYGRVLSYQEILQHFLDPGHLDAK